MLEIVVDIGSSGVLHIEIHISFGHRMVLREMSYYMDILCNGAGLIYQDESAIVNLRPLRSNTMKIPSLGKELTTHCIGRDEYLELSITFNKILQASCMVAVAMRDKYIVHRTEVNTHLLGIADKDITCSCVQQEVILLRL